MAKAMPKAQKGGVRRSKSIDLRRDVRGMSMEREEGAEGGALGMNRDGRAAAEDCIQL